jgi:glycerol-3-phosphate acyltransferase PlsY
MPIYVYFCAPISMVLPIAIMALLILYRHHGNIQRLLKGEEPKIGQKKK